MKLIPFTKMEGTGNDFILIDNRKDLFQKGIKVTDFVKKICDRRFGVGADGMILLERDKETAFFMRYFNSGGDEAAMCGNGARCLAKFAERLGLVNKKFTFRTRSGIHQAEIINDNVKLKVESVKVIEIEKRVSLPSGEYKGDFIDVGIPHYVIYVAEIEEVDVKNIGRAIRNSDAFKPNGTNVNFIKVDKGMIRIRTYERGVENETLACGTGAIGAAISASLQFDLTSPVEVHARGGQLMIHFKRLKKNEFKDIYLEGPARFICDGIYYLKCS
ncbi:MAG: diaminopimelate epimerase [candidate division WOR-3 bacterium]